MNPVDLFAIVVDIANDKFRDLKTVFLNSPTRADFEDNPSVLKNENSFQPNTYVRLYGFRAVKPQLDDWPHNYLLGIFMSRASVRVYAGVCLGRKFYSSSAAVTLHDKIE